jgi:ABC-2 type transport system permease protein
MNKLRSIILWECKTYLRKPSFLFTAFGVPLLLMVVLVVVTIITEDQTGQVDTQGSARYGYVDHAGLIDESTIMELGYDEIFVHYEDEQAARAALDDRANTHIEAYFVIRVDYIQSGQVQLYRYDKTPADLSGYIDQVLTASLATRVATEDGVSIPVDRITQPANLTVHVEDSGRQMDEEGFIPLVVIPVVFAFVLTLAAQMTGGFLMSGLVEEKTNRVMEVLVTSITPEQMLVGKIIGLGLLGLLQLAFWVLMAFIALTVGGKQLDFLNDVTIPIDLLMVAVTYFLLGYALISTFMAGIGAVVGSEQESRQYAGFISLILFIPYFFLVMFIQNPNNPVPVGLSLFPFTAPMAMIMRFGFTPVPLWQLALSILLLIATVILIAWLSAQIFRWGLLRYGKRLRIRDLFKAFRTQGDMGTTRGEVVS